MDPKNIILNTEAEALEDILSPFIEEQFPSFMRSDYRKLVLFIKSYYEWLDQKGNAGYVLGKLDTIYDSDRSLEEFYSHFKNTYLLTFPEVLATNPGGNKPNKNTLLKKIRDFYGNKGTESAYKFLFRVLYDSDLEIYYPKEDILKASDGRWIEPKSIKTTSTNGTALFGGKNGQVVQYSGTQVSATAFIESVVQYSFNGLPVTEFFISDINGEFLPGQEVHIEQGTSDWVETAYSVLGDFFVEIAGDGYRVGDTATVIDTNGVGFSAKIDQVSFSGGVKKIGIANSGLNYSGDLVLNIFSDSGARSAKVVGLRSAVTNYPGYFSGNRGKISSNKKIQDGHYYQDFSYVLKGEVSFDSYFDLLKSIIHPAGMRMFGSVLFKSEIDNTITSSAQATYFVTPVIGQYTPYTTGTTLDLRNNGVTAAGSWLGATGDLYPLGYNPYIGSTSQVGPNGTTTPNGTVFVGTSLGYTWCYVPEGGRTAHNPIGAALGSTASWTLGHERGPDPNTISGLVLWLKPENIGVCGSVANGASMDVWRDASPSANHALPPKWGRWTTDPAYSGVTIDALRPVLQTGITGICFNGGVVYSPQSVWTNSGRTLGGIPGFTFGASGNTAGRILTGQHFYLTNGITLTDDMDVFMVFRSTSDSPARGIGLVSAATALLGVTNDTVFFNRSYNQTDRTAAQQTSEYYRILPDGTPQYPNNATVQTGLVGFRPAGGNFSYPQNTLSYDPHVSGVCLGIVVGEWRRSSNRIETFLNGDAALNRSRSTGIAVADVVSPNNEDFLVRNGLVLGIDGKSGPSNSQYADFERDFVGRSGGVIKPLLAGSSPFPSAAVSPGWLFSSNILSNSVGGNCSITFDRDPWGRKSLVYHARTPSNSILLGTGKYFPVNLTVAPYNLSGELTDAGVTWSSNTTSRTPEMGTVANAGGIYCGGYPDWNYPGGLIRVDHTKMYRFSVWLNRKNYGRPWSGFSLGNGDNRPQYDPGNNSNGVLYFGILGNGYPVSSLNGLDVIRPSLTKNAVIRKRGDLNQGSTPLGGYWDNHYFFARRPTARLNATQIFTAYDEDRWYLYVAHVYPSGTATGGVDIRHPNTGRYTVEGRDTVITDYFESDAIWIAGTTYATLRAFLLYSYDSTPSAQFFDPRMEVVDGSETPISDLISGAAYRLKDRYGNTQPVYAVNSPVYESGDSGYYAFDGYTSGDHFEINPAPDVSVGTPRQNRFTVETVFYPTPNPVSSVNTHYILGSSTNGIKQYLGYDPVKKCVKAVLWDGTNVQIVQTPDNSVPLNTWAHCVLQIDGISVQIWINGQQKLNTTVSLSSVLPWDVESNGTRGRWTLGFLDSSIIGDEPSNDNWFRGRVSDFRVYDRILLPTEIQQNFNSIRSRYEL